MKSQLTLHSVGTRIYANVNVRNNEDNFQPLEYQEIRKAPFITQDVDKYDLAITRFSLSTNTIPLWIPHIETDRTLNPTADINQTRYVVSIVDSATGAVLFQKPIIWSPQDTGASAPPVPLVVANTTTYVAPIISPYYYMNSIDHFVSLMNETIEQAIAAPFSLSSIPKITFDIESGLFSLWAGDEYQEGGGAQKYKLFMNEALSSLLTSFPSEIVNLNDLQLHSFFPFKNLQTNIYEDLTTSGNYEHIEFTYVPTNPFLIRMMQERGSMAQFQVFRGIAFTTIMPIYYENTGTTTPYGVSTNTSQDSTDSTSSIMCDEDCVILDTSAGNQAMLQYQPHFLHYITMAKQKQLDTIQFRVFWKDTYGNLNPMFLRHGSLSLKMVFHRKR